MKTNVKVSNVIKTRELPFAAYIKCKYGKFKEIEKDGRIATWIFDSEFSKEELSKEFFCGGQISAQDYYNELKNLKSMMY